MDDNIFTNLDFSNLNIDLDDIDWDLITNPQATASKNRNVFSPDFI